VSCRPLSGAGSEATGGWEISIVSPSSAAATRHDGVYVYTDFNAVLSSQFILLRGV
jgi:hypothetical protein